MIRIAAVGDLHFGADLRGALEREANLPRRDRDPGGQRHGKPPVPAQAELLRCDRDNPGRHHDVECVPPNAPPGRGVWL